jgi:hypothetical protein
MVLKLGFHVVIASVMNFNSVKWFDTFVFVEGETLNFYNSH